MAPRSAQSHSSEYFASGIQRSSAIFSIMAPDFITDSPFAVAFGERIQTVLRPWRECKERHLALGRQLQEQADQALRHFCFKEDLKWVSLLMWAGADPRSSGPTLDDDEDEEDHLSALIAAAYVKNVQILKRLKPNGNTDDVSELLKFAA